MSLRGIYQVMRRRWQPIFTIVLPPLIAGVLALFVVGRDSELAQVAVEIREDGSARGWSSLAEAVITAEMRTGLKVVLPTWLPNGRYHDPVPPLALALES